ncbi:MAG: tyrosine-type recombinase/integrase [Planctomycetota bacterium]
MAVFKKHGFWWIDYYDEHGERRRQKVSPSKKVAQDTLEEVKTQVRQKKLGIIQKPARKQISIKDFFFKECFEYFDTNLSPDTGKRYKAVLNHFYLFLRQFPKIGWLAQLQPQYFEKYKTYRKNTPFPKGISYFNESLQDLERILAEAAAKGAQPGKSNTINFELRTLRSIFNLAITWQYLTVNPTKGVKFFSAADAQKPRFLSTEEIQRLLENSLGEIHLVFQTFLLTGMRSAELVNLEWPDIDFKNHVIRIRNKEFWQPKRRHERDVPIHATLLPLIEEHKAKNHKRNNFVFCNGNDGQFSENALRRELQRTARGAGIPNLTKIHSLRHTFGSQLVLAGVDLPTVRDLMGHTDIETTMIYVHRTPGHLVDSVNRLRVG